MSIELHFCSIKCFFSRIIICTFQRLQERIVKIMWREGGQIAGLSKICKPALFFFFSVTHILSSKLNIHCTPWSWPPCILYFMYFCIFSHIALKTSPTLDTGKPSLVVVHKHSKILLKRHPFNHCLCICLLLIYLESGYNMSAQAPLLCSRSLHLCQT